MRIGKSFALGMLVGLCAPRFAAADTIAWSQVAQLPAASKIAVCAAGRLYYLDNDGWLWADTNRTGRGPTWQRRSRVGMRVASLSCVTDRLYALSSDKVLYRNDGDDLNLRWQIVARLLWASQVVAGSRGFGAVFYALSTDGVLLTSESGVDGSWRKLGKTLAEAERIAAPSLLDVFALDAKRRLYVNHGGGLAPYWHNVNAPAGVIEIASANGRPLYALANGSLWLGAVRYDVRSVRIGVEGFNARTNVILGFTRITLREVCLSPPRVNPRLLEEGRIPHPGPKCTANLQVTVAPPPQLQQQYGLPAVSVDITGPRLDTIGHFSALSSSHLGASLGQDRIVLSAIFTNARVTPNTPVGPLGFDLVNPSLSGDLVPTRDPWGETVFSLANFSFNGELHGTDIPSTVVTWFVDFRAEVERRLGPLVADSVASPGAQAAIRQVLLQLANNGTGETWQGIAYGGILIERDTLQFRVER